MDTGEPIIDFQDGAMATANSAVDHCTVYVVEDATFDTLTFRNNYNKDRVVNGAAIGTVATETVTTGVVFAAQTEIKGVKSYKLATGSMIAYHYKN